MKEFLNDKPFSYVSSFGSEFSCPRCDFSEPISVTETPVSLSGEAFKRILAKEVAEMIGYHATNILPELNGFQGYDCLKFEFNS